MTHEALFIDRDDAAHKLIPFLAGYKDNANTVVLGLPRGGMIVAARVAEALNLPLDFVVVKKIAAPMNEEFALGAVSEDGFSYFDWSLIHSLDLQKEYIDDATLQKLAEASTRAHAYRNIRPMINLHGKIAIIVDDGIATGSSMGAAVSAVRERGARKIIVAVPVASREGFRSIEKNVDDVVCLCPQGPFLAVGKFYSKFPQIEDEEIIKLLKHNA